jgi:peptide subunit release factor RF-3
MRNKIIPLLLLIVASFACDKNYIPKPDNLIREKKMVDMLVDIQLAEATFNHFRNDSIIKNSSSVNFYYSVLEKYNVPDSVFEKSFVYYASDPKNFEKLYRKVVNRLSELEEEYSGRKKEELELGKPQKQ